MNLRPNDYSASDRIDFVGAGDDVTRNAKPDREQLRKHYGEGILQMLSEFT